MTMENQHAKMMLDIEVHRNRQARNNALMEENLAKVKAREQEIDQLQEEYEQKMLVITRKQRELDIVIKKYNALKEIFDVNILFFTIHKQKYAILTFSICYFI